MRLATRGTRRWLPLLAALVLAGCFGYGTAGGSPRADADPPAPSLGATILASGSSVAHDEAAGSLDPGGGVEPDPAESPDGAESVVQYSGVRPTDDLVFIHHSVGQDWLDRGLDTALVAKSYIDERNDITYGTDVARDSGRRDSLAAIPGDSTDMRHWVLWFNDYLSHVKRLGSATGVNRIIMFKSCFPNSDIYASGREPGDPFGDQILVNYRAIFRHPSGAGSTWTHDGRKYRALEDVFAANPDTLFIVVTAPPLSYAESSDANAHRARVFNNWLRKTWLAAYNRAHPTLHNVAVFDLFNVLANPDSGAHPNRLRAAYGGTTGDAHPNSAGDAAATRAFATGSSNLLDAAWAAFAR